jgi:hypothetical protein
MYLTMMAGMNVPTGPVEVPFALLCVVTTSHMDRMLPTTGMFMQGTLIHYSRKSLNSYLMSCTTENTVGAHWDSPTVSEKDKTLYEWPILLSFGFDTHDWRSCATIVNCCFRGEGGHTSSIC